ncbi:MAG: ABC transporter permease [Actinomycetota bacterium]
MSTFLLLGILGIGVGGFYGLIGAGVVVGHKGAGVINLDQAALAMYPAYGYATLRESGQIFMPWFDPIPGSLDLPVSLDLGGPTSKLVAVGGALAMSVLLGIALHFLVFGPLRDSPPISKIIASLGVLSYLQALASHHFGGKARQVDGILPDGKVENVFGLGGDLPHARIALALIALVAAVLLWAYYRYSNLGLATRAAEEEPRGAQLLGWSPSRLALVNWLISATITGLAGVLFLDVTSLSPSSYTLLIVPALGAALLGNLTSPALAAVGGIAIGMIQSAAVWVVSVDWWPESLPAEGVRDAIPLLIIVGLQFARGHQLPVRSTVVVRPQPRAPQIRRPWLWISVLVAVVALVSSQSTGAAEARLVVTLIACLLMLSSVVLVGYLGQVSLANVAFAGVAAYLMTRLASDGTRQGLSIFVVDGPGLPDPLASLLAVGIATIVGLLVALPALRIRGINLAVVTLAAATATTELVFANPAFVGSTAGANTPVPLPTWFGFDVGSRNPDTGLSDNTAFTVLVTIFLVIALVAVINLRKGAVGRRMLAVRANERAAAAVGVNITGTKLLGFGISAFIAGMAGVVMAYSVTVLNVSTWSPFGGITNLTLLFIGGVGSIAGALIGAALIPAGLLSSSASEGEFLRAAVAGIVMIAIAVRRPDGLSSFGQPFLDRLRRGWTGPGARH